MLLAAAWVFATVPPLNALAVSRGWWSFARGAAEMPVALLIGWVVMWGLLPALAMPRAPVWLVAALALWVDLLAMPWLGPALVLGPGWLWGEALLLALVFVPARLLVEWTARDERLYARAALQVACFGALVLWTLPWAVESIVRTHATAFPVRFAAPVSLAVALQLVAIPALLGVSAVLEFATRGGGTPLPYDPPARLVRSGPYAYVANPMQVSAALSLAALGLRFAAPVSLGVALQFVALPALLGVAAVHEFATRGGGTPLPYDPPARLVQSGPYAYVANPMQLSAALVLAAWGAMTGQPWVIAGGAMSVVYSAGIAGWDEAGDMTRRFGERWTAYRRGVRAWLPRWRPWHPSLDGEMPDVLYLAASCGRCSELGRMIASLRPVGLILAAAEEHPSRDLLRITYAPADGAAEEEGVAALGRALEHVNFACALLGSALRLPVVRPVLQLLVDASGGGRMRVRRDCELPA
jgi:protein-S-isoprenylcysteine O-methyltransferase Ste14